ncbi:uncharacterized protein [Rutidosis leptorrhynchoides]|uniref:uncharacterized protein n=1 Tax=Rutidosis leptorrhynchoides TaxID=125765 RepID=UPI003A999AD5
MEFLAASLDLLFDSTSFDEEEESPPRRNRVQRNPRRFINRDREAAGLHLWNDYFSQNPTFRDDVFKRRFRMRINLFLRIKDGILNHSYTNNAPKHFVFFQQRSDTLGRLGFTMYQKITCALRQLAYGTSADIFDEYIKMAEKTGYVCLNNFCKCIIDLYGREYLRKPTATDVARLYSAHEEKHGFKGMLGSIDCMHWAWKNCPVGWKGQYTRGDHGHPTIMLEAVASYDMWIWHSFLGMAGSNNDINVLNHSPLFDSLKKDTAAPSPFEVNGQVYPFGYYLADGIYPDWTTLKKGILDAY